MNDLDHRYGSYTGIDPRNRGYPGNAFLTQIEELAQDLAKQLFGAAYADLRPLSGNIAGLIAMFAEILCWRCTTGTCMPRSWRTPA